MKHTEPPTEQPDVREQDRRAVELSAAVVRRVTAADLDGATPCAGWTVRDLVLHMAAQHHGFAAAADGRGADVSTWQPTPADRADPVATYPVAAAEVVAAFAAADLDTAQLTLPDFGGMTFPARRAVTFHFIDYLVHAAIPTGVPE